MCKNYQSFGVSHQLWPTCLWSRAFWYYRYCSGMWGKDFILLRQLSALPGYFYLHILFACLHNFTLLLSSWPVDIDHWSSRKCTINLNTITKTGLQKRKIVVRALSWISFPKALQSVGSLTHRPTPCCRAVPYHCLDLIYRWKYVLFGDSVYFDLIPNLFLLFVPYSKGRTCQTYSFPFELRNVIIENTCEILNVDLFLFLR